ncbi:Mu transposase C-terminal domain-containing protein [Ruegeria atlantica]|uniref:Mu transposase C-terminal domain-containing protein n=1 Tax=Ruegeria atlantica TaxID=81569 RepID=UPI00147C1BBB|nr:DDE-type integrase/transposase/recombinase [Ruegeria atlantica]
MKVLPSMSFGCFQINEDDRVTIRGKAMRSVQRTGVGYVLIAADGTGLAQAFTFSELSRLNSGREIKHEPHFYSHVQVGKRLDAPVARISDLSPKQRKRFRVRYAFVSAFEEMKSEDLIAENDKSITANMRELCERSMSFLEEEAPDPDTILRDIEIREGRRARRRGGVSGTNLEPIHARTLRGWLKSWREFGAVGLADQISNRGNRNSYFSPEERELLMKTVRESYLSLNRPTKMNTFEDVKVAFHEANSERERSGLPVMRVPSREAVRLVINSLSKFEVTIARFGWQEAQKTHKPVGQGLQIERPFERVEIDEWKIDLITIMADAGLRHLFSNDELVELGLDNTRNRWWVTAAIDCRTKCIVGLKLSRNPKTSTALECLRMTTMDKGKWADAVGALSDWGIAGTPELLVTDNGPAFKAGRFADACADLGITLERSIAGVPGMRGTVERVFRTASSTLLHRLNGRTFSSAFERGDHPSEDLACLTTEDLCFALVRWVVDIYHNTPHSGLLGKTPLQQWEDDHDKGNYALKSTPCERDDRLAFGTRLNRRVDKYGVTVFGVRYHSETLSGWYNSAGKRNVEIRWLPYDLGAIEVRLEGVWHHVPSVLDVFSGLHAQQWAQARRSLRAADPRKQKWREQAVCQAIKAIRNMNSERSLEFGLIPQNWTEERLAIAEKELFSGFEVSVSEKQSETVVGQYGRILEPSEPEPQETTELSDPLLQKKSSPERRWAINVEDEQ